MFRSTCIGLVGVVTMLVLALPRIDSTAWRLLLFYAPLAALAVLVPYVVLMVRAWRRRYARLTLWFDPTRRIVTTRLERRAMREEQRVSIPTGKGRVILATSTAVGEGDQRGGSFVPAADVAITWDPDEGEPLALHAPVPLSRSMVRLAAQLAEHLDAPTPELAHTTLPLSTKGDWPAALGWLVALVSALFGVIALFADLPDRAILEVECVEACVVGGTACAAGEDLRLSVVGTSISVNVDPTAPGGREVAIPLELGRTTAIRCRRGLLPPSFPSQIVE